MLQEDARGGRVKWGGEGGEVQEDPHRTPLMRMKTAAGAAGGSSDEGDKGRRMVLVVLQDEKEDGRVLKMRVALLLNLARAPRKVSASEPDCLIPERS